MHCLFLLGSSPCTQTLSNDNSITEFLLLVFTNTQGLQLLHFWLFLGIYLAALLGTALIITVVACSHRFHTPMYFLLLTSPSSTWASSPPLSPNPWPAHSGTPEASPIWKLLHKLFLSLLYLC